MFQFVKENKMFTADIAIMLTLILAVITGFATQHPALSIGFMLVGLVFAFAGFCHQVMRPHSK